MRDFFTQSHSGPYVLFYVWWLWDSGAQWVRLKGPQLTQQSPLPMMWSVPGAGAVVPRCPSGEHGEHSRGSK